MRLGRQGLEAEPHRRSARLIMAKRATRSIRVAPPRLRLVVNNDPIPVGVVLPEDDLVTIVKAGNVLRVQPSNVRLWITAGWSVWPAPQPAF